MKFQIEDTHGLLVSVKLRRGTAKSVAELTVESENVSHFIVVGSEQDIAADTLKQCFLVKTEDGKSASIKLVSETPEEVLLLQEPCGIYAPWWKDGIKHQCLIVSAAICNKVELVASWRAPQ